MVGSLRRQGGREGGEDDGEGGADGSRDVGGEDRRRGVHAERAEDGGEPEWSREWEREEAN